MSLVTGGPNSKLTMLGIADVLRLTGWVVECFYCEARFTILGEPHPEFFASWRSVGEDEQQERAGEAPGGA